MGRVYEALDTRDNRLVALKVLHEEVARDDVSVERFRREFEVSRQMRHRHIVEVLDFKPTGDGSYVLVMEFLVGEELRALLKRERTLAPERLIRLLSQVALGMDYAHQSEWVHRDLKPDNLFLCQTSKGDQVKVLDFGSVKDRSSGAKQLTIMGTTIGSPFYMSPEQAQGLESLDHRTDVWAMAAIAYECSTGCVPFVGTNGPSILLQILSGTPLVASEVAPDTVPAELDAVFSVALQKTPSDRTESIGRLADDVGHAFGLTGGHAEWAEITESDLRARLRKIPEVVAIVDPSGGTPAASSEPAGYAPMDTAFRRAAEPAATSARGSPRVLVWRIGLCVAIVGLFAWLLARG
jgi:serine/threonine-protein kinase